MIFAYIFINSIEFNMNFKKLLSKCDQMTFVCIVYLSSTGHTVQPEEFSLCIKKGMVDS